jgi:hypothetical protein
VKHTLGPVVNYLSHYFSVLLFLQAKWCKSNGDEKKCDTLRM